MSQDEYDAAVVAFINTKGVTRCPTAFALPTEGTVSTADRAALKAYAVKRERSRQRKIAAHAHLFAAVEVSRSADE